jgi:hypothetical protein
MTAKTVEIPPILTFVFAPLPGIRRELKVHTPDEGQLAVWAASAERFSTLGAEWASQSEALAGRDEDDPDVLAFRQQRNEQATRALTRAMKIVTSALVEQADRDWIEDGLLDRKFGLTEALGVITGAVEELRRLKGSAALAAPTNGPAKKARRG